MLLPALRAEYHSIHNTKPGTQTEVSVALGNLPVWGYNGAWDGSTPPFWGFGHVNAGRGFAMRALVLPKLLFCGTMIALLLLAADAAVAQRSGRDGSRRGGFDPNRPMTQEEMQQRLERMDGLLQQLDTNHNGMLDADEVSGGRQQFIEGMLSRAGVELKYPIPLSTIHDAMAKSFQGRVTQPVAPPPAASAAGRRLRLAHGARARVRRSDRRCARLPASARRVRRERSPVLGRRGPAPNRRPANPHRQRHADPPPRRQRHHLQPPRRLPRHGVSPGVPGHCPRPLAPGPRSRRGARRRTNQPRSERFLTPRERLPKGLPAWFLAKDVHGNGQITHGGVRHRVDPRDGGRVQPLRPEPRRHHHRGRGPQGRSPPGGKTAAVKRGRSFWPDLRSAPIIPPVWLGIRRPRLSPRVVHGRCRDMRITLETSSKGR